MFKLEKSMAAAAKLAEKDPDLYRVGSTAWVTARFTAEKPIPKKLWETWLDESYALSTAVAAGKKKATKAPAKTKSAAKKKAAKKPKS